MREPSQPEPDAILRQTTSRLAAGPDDAALALLHQAVLRHPGHAALAGRLADALHLARRLPEAIAAYRRALRLDPTLFEACYGLGCAYLSDRGFADAAAALGQAVALRPDAAGAQVALAEAQFGLGEVDAALAGSRHALATGNAAIAAAACRVIATLAPGAPTCDNAAVRAARSTWMHAETAGIRRLPRRAAPSSRKLRVGYLSAFFGAANWMKPVFAVINRHDRARFEIHLISDGDDPAAASGYREHDQDRLWQVRGMPNVELAAAIAEAGIDVLVDLNGYSLAARLALFAHRPARAQLGWFNMFATTGAPGMDALIGDHAVIGYEEEQFYSERIHRVPGSYLAFEVLYPVPDIAAPPCLASGQLTFGCLGSAYKLTPDTLAAWAAILRAAPAARLFVQNPTLDNAGNRAHLLGRLAALGVATERVATAGRAPHYDFLAGYDRVDIALDSFPYNGGTTTTEALWQGVPVLTCTGDRWAGRTSRSLLLAGGLAHWVAPDLGGFVAEGIRLANDPATPAMLATLRPGLRAQLAASPACDTGALCTALEAIYADAARR